MSKRLKYMDKSGENDRLVKDSVILVLEKSILFPKACWDFEGTRDPARETYKGWTLDLDSFFASSYLFAGLPADAGPMSKLHI
jgi:hypothetical protein